MSTHTMKTFTAVLLAGGLLLTAPTVAGALDTGPLGPLGALDTGSLGTESLGPEILADTPRLASVANFRDVAGNAGAGYTTPNGHHLNRGVIYRSDAPTKTSEADLATLTALGVADAYDMRGQSEITNPLIGGQDKLPADTVYKNVPIEFSNLIQLAQTITSPEQAAQFLVDTNKSFVTDAAKRTQFATVLTDIANNDGAQLFHCTSGKDRTGWTAMLLQSLAGLPKQTIMNDYLLSNTYLEETNQKILQQITGALGAQAAANLTPILGVDASYLQAGLDQITADYGTVGKYLSEGLDLDEATIAKLKAKLLA